MKLQNKFLLSFVIVLLIYLFANISLKYFNNINLNAYLFNFGWNITHASKYNSKNLTIDLPSFQWILLGKNDDENVVFQGVFVDVNNKKFAPTILKIKESKKFIEKAVPIFCEKGALYKKQESINNKILDVLICDSEEFKFKTFQYQDDLFFIPNYSNYFNQQYRVFYNAIEFKL